MNRHNDIGLVRVNVGCGPRPTPGWTNIDNSPSVVLSRLPRGMSATLKRAGLLTETQLKVVDVARHHRVRRGSATRLPFSPESVDVIYSCHMLEHLDRNEAQAFLAECRRVLRPGGRLRLVVPDLAFFVDAYRRSGDADEFFAHLRVDQPRLPARRRFAAALVGFRGHRWMYDRQSLARLVEKAGFEEVDILEPGETRISDPGALDLREREDQSVYLEAMRN
jgi:predicted SAM-dependent methyltransferase